MVSGTCRPLDTATAFLFGSCALSQSLYLLSEIGVCVVKPLLSCIRFFAQEVRCFWRWFRSSTLVD